MKSGGRQQLWTQLNEVRRDWVSQPPVLVEVSKAQIRRVERLDFDGLPEGIELAPGSITVRFHEPDEALRKLAGPRPGYQPESWPRRSTTCHYTGKRRSLSATVWRSRGRPWAAGWDNAPIC